MLARGGKISLCCRAEFSAANGMFLASLQVVLYSFHLARRLRQPPGRPGAFRHRAFLPQRPGPYPQAMQPALQPKQRAKFPLPILRAPAGKTRKYTGNTHYQAWHNVIKRQPGIGFPKRANPSKGGDAKPWVCTGSGGLVVWSLCPDDSQAAEANLSNLP